MIDFEKAQKIHKRMEEHLQPVLKSHKEWVGLFLQGSQNYNLDYEGSDIDTKVIVIPNFTDFVLNAKPVSTTHIMENDEHVDFKDIRLMFDCIKKQNVNFVEILFTPYSIINPKYADLFQSVLDAKEDIARYNNYKSRKRWSIPTLLRLIRLRNLAMTPNSFTTPYVSGSF